MITDIDNFGNCYTNIPDEKLYDLKQISVRAKHYATQTTISFNDFDDTSDPTSIGITKDGDGYLVLFRRQKDLSAEIHVSVGDRLVLPEEDYSKTPINQLTTGKLVGSKNTSLSDIVSAIGAACETSSEYLLEHTHHTFDGGGLTLLAVISSSHIAVHTWPEKNYLHLDVFSCNGKSQKLFDTIAAFLGGVTQDKKTYDR